MKTLRNILLFLVFTTSLLAANNLKVLEKENIKGIKYSITYQISLDKGVFPGTEIIKSIAENDIKNNPGYERYFIHFLLPGMELNNGAYAIVNVEGNSPIKPVINYFMLNGTKYQQYLKTDKNGNYYLENINTGNSYKVTENKTIKPLSEVGAQVNVDYYLENGKLKVILKTNLPTWMKINLTLENKKTGYMAQDDGYIDNFKELEGGLFSDRGFRLPKGKYILTVSSPFNNLQERSVTDVIGEKGEKMKSKYTKELFGQTTLDFKKTIIVK
ncbi:hypothetical protein SAMN02745174_02504 [Cetobacterium ceti]|uniref:Uncharacterized protein n=1 Tax=Cetobacterium ceti TaxID=180163 RepID=A0A1T4QZ10_9FUSO|nr:hypothetical protein [Cetobacterium ceti]SKA08701.1 hypothetical protein SAMN02745174_02504 [Cetobacterium ceti]